MGKGRRFGGGMVTKKQQKNMDINTIINNTINSIQNFGSNMFRINILNTKDFFEYIQQMDALLEASAEEIKSLAEHLEDAKQKIQIIKETENLPKINELYDNFRKHQYFSVFIEELSKTPPEEQGENSKKLFLHYTSFFSKSTQIKTMIKKMIKSIIPQGSSSEYKDALEVLDSLGDYFDSNCQKYYINFIECSNNSGVMVQNIIEDITNAYKTEEENFKEGDEEKSSEKKTAKEDKVIKSLIKIIDIIKFSYPAIQEKIDPFYDQIKMLVKAMDN